MIDTVEALLDIGFERILRSSLHRENNGSNRLPTGAAEAKAIGLWRPLGFPCGFQRLAYQRLLRPVLWGWNLAGAFHPLTHAWVSRCA